jgi:tetratricopeptide (TPR) repeat protein
VGVLIHGMGGLGKSTLAARLCDRLPEFERIVWVGRVDEGSLVKRLTEKLPKELRQVLQSDDDELKIRLRDVFAQLEEEAAQPFLLVLDDFEHNLEPRNDGYVLQPEAAMVLEALLWAIEETYARHRVILTCRYDFESGWLQKFYKQPLEGLRGADLEKKCNRLSAFGVNSQVDEALQSQALRLADGNPRLLEWLDKVLLNLDPPQPPFFRGEKNTVAEILARLETNPVELRQKVLAQALLAQIDQPLEEILRRGLVFELPVPRDALATVCEEIPSLDTQINRAVALGLLEVTPDESLRVPRILEKNLTLQPPSLPGKGEKEPGKGENVSSFTPAEDAQQAGNRENNSSFSPLLVGEGLGERLYQQAAEVLYRLWWEEAETSTEEQRLEIHRLALGGKAEEIAVEMAVALTNHWINRSLYREVVKTCEETLEVVEDSGILYRLALCEQELGEVDKALGHYQQALDSCPSGDKAKKAAIIHNLAIIKANQGQTEEAITLYEQSLTLKEDIGDLQGKAATLQQLGIVKYNTGEIEEAIAIYQQSLVLTERIGDVNTKAAILHCLAIIKTHQGQIEEARELYMQSLALSESNGNVQGKAATLQCLGYLKAVQGQTEEAITFYEQSLALTEDIGHAQTKAITLHELGRLKENSGEIEEAIALYEQSLALTESTGNVQTKASTLQCLGYLKANSGEIEEAIALFQQSLALAESSSNFQTQAATLQCLGYLKANSGEIEEAIALYKQSLALSESNGYAQIKAATLHRLGQMLADEKEDFAAALNCLQQSLDIWQDIQSPKAEEVRQAIARVQQMRDDIR